MDALGVVLGPLMEKNLRRAMLLSRGDPSVFLTRPISAGFIIASVLLLVLLSLPALRRTRDEIFAEEQPAEKPSSGGLALQTGGRHPSAPHDPRN